MKHKAIYEAIAKYIVSGGKTSLILDALHGALLLTAENIRDNWQDDTEANYVDRRADIILSAMIKVENTES